MNVQARILLCTLAGVAAGLLTWFVTDMSGLMHISDEVRDCRRVSGGSSRSWGWCLARSWAR
jgi:hypothetical protein